MKANIDHIAFRVADLEKAIRFYTEVMGCDVADRFFVDFECHRDAALVLGLFRVLFGQCAIDRQGLFIGFFRLVVFARRLLRVSEHPRRSRQVGLPLAIACLVSQLPLQR